MKTAPPSAQSEAQTPLAEKPGLITARTPMKAIAMAETCRILGTSFRNSHEKRTVKNGAVLFNVIASAMGILDRA